MGNTFIGSAANAPLIGNFDDLSKRVRIRFDNQITLNGDGGGAIPTQFENLPFPPPNNTLWCHLTIRSVQTRQITMGAPRNRRYRHPGVAMVMIMAPPGQGEKIAKLLADRIWNVFNGSSYNGVTYRAVSIGNPRKSGANWITNVTWPFYSDIIK